MKDTYVRRTVESHAVVFSTYSRAQNFRAETLNFLGGFRLKARNLIAGFEKFREAENSNLKGSSRFCWDNLLNVFFAGYTLFANHLSSQGVGIETNHSPAFFGDE